MKQVLSVLFLSFVAIPVLTVTQASANDGDGRGHKEDQLTKWNQHLKFGERDRDYRGYMGSRRLDDSPTPPGTGDPATPGGSGNGQSAPLDGGLSLLLAAGIGLGAKKANQMRKTSRQRNSEIPE